MKLLAMKHIWKFLVLFISFVTVYGYGYDFDTSSIDVSFLFIKTLYSEKEKLKIL
jgi:hypothetical protein